MIKNMMKNGEGDEFEDQGSEEEEEKGEESSIALLNIK